MGKRRIKKKVKILGIGLLSLIILIIILVKLITFLNSYPHKLDNLGYSKEDIKIILKLDKDKIENILSLEFNSNIPKLINSKYFIYNKLSKYLDYYKENSNLKARDVVEIINVNRDKKYYTGIKSSDISKGTSTLLNKYYALNKEYKPIDLENMSLQYAFAGNKLIKEAYENFVELVKAAKEKDYNIIASSSFRDFDSQEKIYLKEETTSGKEEADKLVARPGHSEHQLGLAVDIDLYKKEYDKLEDTEEYKWLLDNAHKYGFILRYPKEKENITGYGFEPWHYRYVGNTIAEYIYKNKITYDEYYAYYIEK